MPVALYPLSSPNHNRLFLCSSVEGVALYPLSSPNHNAGWDANPLANVALYPLSSPNHNLSASVSRFVTLRYILFHHQTTTNIVLTSSAFSCVISSFITKPQLRGATPMSGVGCVISSFITKPQPLLPSGELSSVALYPLSSPNHNVPAAAVLGRVLRYILFHHQTTTLFYHVCHIPCCVISSFITKPQLII